MISKVVASDEICDQRSLLYETIFLSRLNDIIDIRCYSDLEA